jgi:aspartyl protease family protein
MLLLCGGAHPTQAGDSVGLTPFIGETVEEFEARKRGIQLGQANDSSAVLTVSADEWGHFFVEPTIGIQRMRMLVDTGASVVALSYEDAERVPIRVRRGNFTHKVATANGVVEAAPVRISEIRLGNIVVRNVDAVVLPPGRSDISLLGMTFLKRLSGFEISGGRLVLRP